MTHRASKSCVAKIASIGFTTSMVVHEIRVLNRGMQLTSVTTEKERASDMADMCGDNRFEIIAKAKADLLEGTNIETDEAEMAVLDNILFRCWQMGWLDRYDRKTESNSEIPNNCDTCKHNKLEWYSEVCDGCSKAHSNYEPKDEPQMERSE